MVSMKTSRIIEFLNILLDECQPENIYSNKFYGTLKIIQEIPLFEDHKISEIQLSKSPFHIRVFRTHSSHLLILEFKIAAKVTLISERNLHIGHSISLPIF